MNRPPFPADLAARVGQMSERLEIISRQIGEVETGGLALRRRLDELHGTLGRDAAALVDEGKKLRHEFNSLRTAINVLMAEVDEREPVKRKS